MNPALRYAERIAYSSKEVLRFTFDQAVKYKDSPGVYVECGVAAGAQIIAMAAGAPDKTIYAFDSFEGIPLPSNRDDQMPGIAFLTKAEQMALPDPGKQALESSGATKVSFEDFKNHVVSAIGSFDKIYTWPGWFEETLPKFINESVKDIDDVAKLAGSKFSIAILRLDGDLYNSTYVCLKYLYPKVIKGGIVIIDDWALPGCRDAVYDYFENIKKLPPDMEFIKGNDSTVAYWHK